MRQVLAILGTAFAAILWLYIAARVVSRAITRSLDERKQGHGQEETQGK